MLLQVHSATIHDIVHAVPELVVPLSVARSRVHDLVEEAFAREMELVPEFTSLIEWGPGSSIGWHHDANRPYLRRRDYTAVLYLNSAGADFGGGSLSFRAGEPREVEPRAGTVVAYGTGPGDEHRVEPVLWGHRSTLTMWFSLDGAAAEDAAVLRALNDPRRQGLPEEMYLREDGADVRAERVERLGFELRRADAAGRGATSDAAPSEVWLIRDRTSSGGATEARGIARAAMAGDLLR